MLRRSLTALLFLSLLSPLARARILVVDAAGGPNVFADIQAGVDAASEFDVVLVRKGVYSGFRIHSKQLTVIGEPGARIAKGTFQSLIISELRRPTFVPRTVVSGLHFDAQVSSQIAVIGYPGTVVLDTIQCTGQMRSYDFSRCEHVHIERCQLQGVCMFQGETTATVVDSVLKGVSRAPTSSNGQRPAILANGEAGRSLYLSASSVRGADAWQGVGLPGAAIEANGRMRVVLRGDSSHKLEPGKGTLSQSAILSAFVTQAELVMDPALTVLGANNGAPVSWSGRRTNRPGATLTVSAGQVGVPLVFDYRSSVAPLHVLLVGAPRAPAELPGIGELTLSLAGLSPVVVVNGSKSQYRVPVPNLATLRGLAVGWQGVAVTSQNAVLLSNGCVTSLR